MFKGYLGYGTVEVLNVARLVKYAEEGGAPEDTQLLDPQVGDYSDLAAALGDQPYRTVLLDNPPWYDATNPDSAFFSGLLPLEITGLDGSTKTRTVTEGLEDGGVAGRARGSSRVIGVTALALASSDAALDAGLTWLTGVLHPPCAGAPEACGGAPLSLFSAVPTYCDTLPNLDADPITSDLIIAPLERPGPTLAYYDLYETFLEPICGEVSITAEVQIGDTEEGEETLGRVVQLDLVDSTGAVHASTSADLPADGSPVTLTVTFEPSPGFPQGWQPVLSWYGPFVYDGGDSDDETDMILDGGGSEGTDDLFDGGDSDGPWLVGSGYGGNLEVLTWTYTRQPFLTTDECLSELRRSFRNVVTIEGPTVVEELAYPDGEPYGAKIEWTWVATDPVPYGDTISLIRGMRVGAHGFADQLVVDAATTGNTSLTAPAPPREPAVYSIDGVIINTVGQRVLFKNQSIAANNGIRVFQGYGLPWVRATDMDAWSEVPGALVVVNNGTVNDDTIWECTSAPGGTIDVTAITFAPFVGDPDAFDNTITYRAPGLQIADNADVDGEDVTCPLPAPDFILCGDDPDLGPVSLPPTPPTLADPGMPTVEEYTRREFQVPPELSPQPGGMLSFVIRNLGDVAYRGVRVRLWADDDPDFGVTEECEFESEFYIAYLPAEQTVTIEGPDHRVWVTCASGLEDDHERNMRGSYGGPFVFPQFKCGSRYHIAIDVPITEDAHGIVVDLSVTRRGA